MLANPDFGSLVTHAGPAFTWSENSRENRLTPFANDPVVDLGAEAFYLRDERDRRVLGRDARARCRAPRRRRAGSCRHGSGVTRYQHERDDLAHELAVFVAADDPVKFSVLTHREPRRRAAARARLRLLRVEPGPAAPEVHGARRDRARTPSTRPCSRPTPTTRTSPTGRRSSRRRRARARRPATASSSSAATAARAGPPRSRREASRAASAPALDPCGALEVEVEIPPGEQRTVTFLLGQGRDRAHAAALLDRYADPARGRRGARRGHGVLGRRRSARSR